MALNGIQGGGNMKLQGLQGVGGPQGQGGDILMQMKELLEKIAQVLGIKPGQAGQGPASGKGCQSCGGAKGAENGGSEDPLAMLKKFLQLAQQNPEMAAQALSQVPGMSQMLGGQSAGTGALAA